MNTERTDSDAPRHIAITPTATLLRAPDSNTREAAKPGDVLELSNQPKAHMNGHFVVVRVAPEGIDLVPYNSGDGERLIAAAIKRERRAARRGSGT